MSEVEARKLMVFNDDFLGIDSGHIKEIYGTIGGNPKAIGDLGRLIKEGKYQWTDLKGKLEAVQKEMREFTLFEELYTFLSEPERSFFRKVSVYQGPVTHEGVEVHEPDGLQIGGRIRRLVDYTLLQEYRDELSGTLFSIIPNKLGIMILFIEEEHHID
jgi:hypothetical protein